MIVDLNLKGQQVLIVGGGREASRKVEALMSQDCSVHVIAEKVCPEIETRGKRGDISLELRRLSDTALLSNYKNLILVMAITDDPGLNRKIVRVAQEMGCYAYAADDPSISDFSHPAVINLYDTVQIAVSTGGKSPLMARKIRELAEKVFAELISPADVLQIRLQDRLRPEAKKALSQPEDRKQFLESVLNDPEILQFLENNRFEEAEAAAVKMLKRRSNRIDSG